MEVEKRTPSKRRANSVKKVERLSPEDALKQLLEDHKKGLGEMVSIKIDSRTFIEVPASMSEEDRQKRVENFLRYSNFKPYN